MLKEELVATFWHVKRCLQGFSFRFNRMYHGSVLNNQQVDYRD